MSSVNRRVVGIDIGGANLKYCGIGTDVSAARTKADPADAGARSTFFPMWQRSGELAAALADDLVKMGSIESLAITMTGELADCFTDRRVGVQHIVEHVIQAARQIGVSDIWFYAVDGRFYDAPSAINRPDLIAAANWHALANYVGQDICRDGVLADIGSTTTDIIPIADGHVATEAQTDHDRLIEGSLVYIGCRRTPVCAIVDHLTLRGQSANVMNELFATIDDARIVLGSIGESPSDTDTADGKPRTVVCAANRLARMIGLDRRTVSSEDAVELATQIVEKAKSMVAHSLSHFRQQEQRQIIVSGHAPDLLDLPDEDTTVLLAEVLGEHVSRCAPAYAVAKLFASKSTKI